VPEYLAPGVYVEETSFRSKSIEGVGTSTTAFVGPTLKGPSVKDGDEHPLPPELLTSFADFERIYGGFGDLSFGGSATPNYLAHAAQAYFNNGGARLYVVRVANGDASASASTAVASVVGPPALAAKFIARFNGAAFTDGTITVQQVATPTSGKVLPKAPNGSIARVLVPAAGGGGGGGPPPAGTFALWFKSAGKWQRRAAGGAAEDVPAGDISGATEAYLITLTVEFVAGTERATFDGLSASEDAPRFIGSALAKDPDRRADAVSNPIALAIDDGFSLAPDAWLNALVGNTQPTPNDTRKYVEPQGKFTLTGGGDGSLPQKIDYEAGFNLLRAFDDISIVAAPGYSARTDSDSIQDALISHVENKHYRIAVLDSPEGKTPSEMRDIRGKIDTTRAALYYPWITITNPLAGPNSLAPLEINVPPSGSVCGIYARNDVARGVFKAPANEVVRGALRFERFINFGEQELLNPLGVNCLRFLPGRGYRVWGARTASSDPEWKYVNIRRYFNYLEASIDRGTQWAVFEPNGEMLWANVRNTISDFLLNEWTTGALLGSKPEQAYFVRCDRSTMTQNDLDNGRLICLIGVAAVKPAEFVIFRIGQKTADAAD
jgi:phage tail sheath protein FI